MMKFIPSYPAANRVITAVILSIGLTTVLTACGNKPENSNVPNDTTKVATEKDVPMSAQPAKVKAPPIAVDDAKNTAGTAAPVVENTASAAAGTAVANVTDSKLDAKASPINAKDPKSKKSLTAEKETDEDTEEDNSGMDDISADDEVVDDAPASPDAPTAADDSEKSANKVSHAKTAAKHNDSKEVKK